MSRFERPRSLTDLVADRLRRDIVDGVYGFGECLSEVTIARKLDVSRTPVREAFARLENERLVRSEPQRGTFVFSMGRDELIQICDVRLMLEAGALRLGMERDRNGLHKALATRLERMEQARERGDAKSYLRLDADYHQALIEGAGNLYLEECYQAIGPRMAALRNKLGVDPDSMTKSYAEHRHITAHIGADEAGAAIRMLTTHIGRKEGSYWNI
ncbi:MAG: GntR family transcriptional regulator [Paracoccaceae bacterium]